MKALRFGQVSIVLLTIVVAFSCGSGGGSKDSGVGDDGDANVINGDDGGADAQGDQPTAPKIGQISANHGHVAVLSGAQLDAGASVSLDIRGSASHSHTLDLNGTQVTSIKNGTLVTQESSTNSGHSHTVTFN